MLENYNTMDSTKQNSIGLAMEVAYILNVHAEAFDRLSPAYFIKSIYERVITFFIGKIQFLHVLPRLSSLY